MYAKENKITIRFDDEELEIIKKRAKEKDVKVATLIRNMTLNSITSESLLTNEEEIKKFIIKVIEESNDKKLGRIISLIFRATSHTDMVKEQLDLLFKNLNNFQNEDKINTTYSKHYVTKIAEARIEKRDKQNIIRKKSGANLEFYD